MEFTVKKILTHNIVIGENRHKEYILLGKGIGFQRKLDSFISETETSNYYIIKYQSMKKSF